MYCISSIVVCRVSMDGEPTGCKNSDMSSITRVSSIKSSAILKELFKGELFKDLAYMNTVMKLMGITLESHARGGLRV